MHRIEAELIVLGRAKPVCDGTAFDADPLADIGVPARPAGVRRAARRAEG